MNLPKAYHKIELNDVKLLGSGKVRDLFDLGDKMLMVASDRVSAFDVVLPNAIPYKGKVLNSLSAFWFRKTRDIIENHFVTDRVEEFPVQFTGEEKDLLKGRASLVRKGHMIEVECVVRGYLDGSGWRSYRDTGNLFDIKLPSNLKQGDKLTEPIFTPTTKAKDGAHDEYIGFKEMKKILGDVKAEYIKDKSLELYNFAHQFAHERGIILADTKFEFAIIDDKIKLADEIFTPDSSRYWDIKLYKPGGPQQSYDKQFIRDWLDAQNWDKTPPAPTLPDDVVEKTVEKYLEVFKKITGSDIRDE